MKDRIGKNALERFKNNTEKKSFQYNASESQMIAERNRKSNEKKIKFFDERYSIIVDLFMKEIEKRKINIEDKNFNDQMDEILEKLFQSKFFEMRFPNDNVKDVKNAVLRKVNSLKQQKLEKGRDYE